MRFTLHLVDWRIASLLGACAVMLFWIWFRRRVPVGHPVCTRCGYNLTGSPSGRCPECGTPITEASHHASVRPAGWLLMVAGLILLIPLCIVVVRRVRQVQWYQHYPAGWIISDAESADASTAARGWAELIRRRYLHALSSRNRQRMIAYALSRQTPGLAPRPRDADFIDFVGQLWEQGALTDAQRARFCKQMIGPAVLKVRPRVCAGDDIPYSIEGMSFAPSSEESDRSIYVQERIDELRVDGQVRMHDQVLGGWSSGYRTGRTIAMQTEPVDRGRHHIRVQYTQMVTLSVDSNGERETLVSRHDDVDAVFEVVNCEEGDGIRVCRDDATGAAIRAAIKLNQFRMQHNRAGDDCGLTGRIESSALPVAAICTTVLRMNGADFEGPTIRLRPGDHHSGSVLSVFDLPCECPEKLDIVLDCAAGAARHTVDIFEAWQGRIVLEGVPLTCDLD